MTDPQPAGRRMSEARSSRLGPVEIVAIVVPLLTIAALALVRPAEQLERTEPPTEAGLSRTTIVCPPAGPDASDTVEWGSAEAARGEIQLTGDRAVEIDGTRVTKFAKAVWATAEGELATGLLGTRSGVGVASTCDAPAPEQWFAGAGAAPEHSSTLLLANPDAGPAVADVTVHGADGELDVPQLRGVTVPGRQALEFDLADLVPSRDELTLRVQVPRGRLGVHVLDTVDDLGRTRPVSDWLPAQATVERTLHLPGLGEQSGDRTLVVSNAGDAEARIQVRLISEQSEFAPDALDELQVAPGATASLDLGGVLRGRTGRGSLGLRLDSTQPVAAGVRTVADGDLSHAVAGMRITERAAILVPSGKSWLVVAGADATGELVWTALDKRGEELASRSVRVSAGRGWRIELPARTSQVQVSLSDAGVVAAVESISSGLTALPMRPLQTSRLIPNVQPALR